jgi:hypothetical protein
MPRTPHTATEEPKMLFRTTRQLFHEIEGSIEIPFLGRLTVGVVLGAHWNIEEASRDETNQKKRIFAQVPITPSTR